jgi:serine/threonine protein kinase
LFSYIKTGYTRGQNQLCHMIFIQILNGLNYMHRDHGIAHLDIKLENVVVNDKFVLKVIDFAFCEKIDKLIYDCRGTDIYLAPEVLANKGSKSCIGFNPEKADVFSLGILLFILFFGQNPFKSNSPLDPSFPLLTSGSESVAEEYFSTQLLTARANAMGVIP